MLLRSPFRSPPGMSRSAMRQARDSVTCAGRQCRFGITSLGTVPSTPKAVSCLASVGSPSKRVSMCHTRDTLKAATWSSCEVVQGDSRASPAAPSEMELALTLGPYGNPISPPHRVAKQRAVREALMTKARNAGMPLRVQSSMALPDSGERSGVLDPTRPAKKALAFSEFAPASAAHWSSDRPLKKAVSKFLLGQDSCCDAAPR
jgi:hypothetical protein